MSRASTFSAHGSKKDVDGRDKPGHDEPANVVATSARTIWEILDRSAWYRELPKYPPAASRRPAVAPRRGSARPPAIRPAGPRREIRTAATARGSTPGGSRGRC